MSRLPQVYDDRPDEVFALPNHPSAAHCSTPFSSKKQCSTLYSPSSSPKRCSKTQPRRFRSLPVSLLTTPHFQRQPLDCPTHPLSDVLQPCQDEQRSHKKPPSSIAVETSSDKSSLVHGIPSISPPGLHFIQNPSQRQPLDTSLVSRLRQVYDDRLDEVFALPNHPSAAHCLRSSTSTHTSDARESGGFNNRRGLVRLTRSLLKG